MANDLLVISKEDVTAIVQNAPNAYNENIISHDKCLEAGQNLLKRIDAAGGLNDELDQEVAKYLEKTRKTVKKMNESRSPITKLFDEYRKVFTKMENDIDPTKAKTIPNTLQDLRNSYAARKRAEEEKRRQEEARKAQYERDKQNYISAFQNELSQHINATINTAINELTELFAHITLDNFTQSEAALRGVSCDLPSDWNSRYGSSLVYLPLTIDRKEAAEIRAQAEADFLPRAKEQYAYELECNRDDYVNRLGSKKRELEAIAKASAEEAERRRAEIAAREAEEARRKEEERKAREAEEAARAQIASQAADMDSLFSANQDTSAIPAASAAAYVPKASTKMRVNVLNVEGYSAVFALWWARVGSYMSMEELNKIFKTQITYAEKMANDKVEPFYIKDESIEYYEEVKAK